MGETDYHMAIYLCRETRKHLEELGEGRIGNVPGKVEFARDLERQLNLNSDQMVAALISLEMSIGARDIESMARYESMVDSLVDFLNRVIEEAQRSESGRPHGMRMQELRAWRDSTGRLAQLLCQSIE